MSLDSESPINLNTETNNSPKPSPQNSMILFLLEKNLQLPTYSLTDNEKYWIQNIIKYSPESFKEMDKFLEPVFTSGQINVHIIPNFIKLLADTYHSISNEKSMFNYNFILTFINYTIDVVLDFISLPDFEKIIIKAFVNSSISLLTTNVSQGKEESFFEFSLTQLTDIILTENSTDSAPAETGIAENTEASVSISDVVLSKNNCCWNLKLF